MPEPSLQPGPIRFKDAPQWILFLFALGMLTFSTLAFMKPIFQGSVDATPSPISPTMTEAPNAVVATPTAVITPTEVMPPTPEEIGYTDGIILFSTILVVIVLVATLREVLWHRGHD